MIRRAPFDASTILHALAGGLILAAAVLAAGQPRAGNGAEATWPAFDAEGHRGARGLYPENTLPAFQAALAIGVNTLEMDVGMTADGVLVVHHDRRLNPDRTRGPDGAWIGDPAPTLASLTFAELAAFDIGRAKPGSRIAARFPGQARMDGVHIPALSAVLRRAEALSGGAIRYNIEVKTAPDAPQETAAPEVIADALVAAIREAGAAGRAMIQSFDWRALKRVQEMAPDIPTVYLTAQRSWLDNLQRGQPGASPWTAGIDVDDYDGSAPRAVHAAGGAVWSPYFRDMRPADLAEAHRLGLKVVVWTVDEPTDMVALIGQGVDGIITDYPDRLRQVIAKKGLPLPPAFGARP
jgi:glycerophosphoryl diester phosphodiesterase